MSKTQDLLAANIITQATAPDTRYVFNVPIFIKEEAIEAGGFELFAGQYGWTPTGKDENGNDIANPQTATDKCTEVIWEFVREVFKGAMIKQAQEQARVQAEAQIEGLMS